MAEFPALPLWTDALIGDTYHLTPAEFGGYLRLLIAAWRTKTCSLPFDDVMLGRMVGDPKNWHRLKPRILPFFTIQEDSSVSCGRVLRQKRLSDERDYVARHAAKSSAGGKAKALKGRHMASAKRVPNECQTDAPTPTPTPTKTLVQSKPIGRTNGLSIESQFLDFYSSYPNKKAKKSAFKAYTKARHDVSHETIMAGLKRAIDTDRRFREKQFTPHPASWLNAGCYDDEAASLNWSGIEGVV